MCTVSFVNSNGKIIITSNRDEKVVRPTAIEPRNYLVNNKNIIFPKDNKAGGTWYAIDEDSNVLVLLNGAEEKHQLKEQYRKSRGLIVLDLISMDSPFAAWKAIDLNNIEPFTLVLFEKGELYQLRWNEVAKETTNLHVNQNHIWSSSTLYPLEVRAKRAEWFYTFVDAKPLVDEEEMFNFHRYTEAENQEHGLVINRNEALKTLSITQTVIDENKVTIRYADLEAKEEYSNSFISI